MHAIRYARSVWPVPKPVAPPRAFGLTERNVLDVPIPASGAPPPWGVDHLPCLSLVVEILRPFAGPLRETGL
jgi:hypothetical protein